MPVVDENGLDPTMGVDNFGNCKVLSETETICRNLLLVLFGKPGFYPTYPDLGMDIKQYLYEFDDFDTNKIKTILQIQCEELVPEIDAAGFDVTMTSYKGQGMLVIQFPIILNDDRLAMVLGITTNRRGEYMYRFVEDKNQLI